MSIAPGNDPVKRLVAGVEDAGRGPVIGPLVIAGVLLEEDNIKELTRIGVKDSKLLSPHTRTQMARQIGEVAKRSAYVEISPAQIDEVVEKGRKLQRLNYLEAQAMASVIEQLQPHSAYVDASDVNAERYGRQITELLPEHLKAIRIISEHHADRRYPIVSAASILAKVRRDEIVEGLRTEYGDFGSGYATDPRTLVFLKGWRLRYGSYPPIARKSWKTLRKIETGVAQSRLSD